MGESILMMNKVEQKEGGKKPVSVGQVVKVKISSLGKQGDGIAVIGNYGFVIMVNGARLGQECEVQITRVLSTMAFGRVLGKEDKVVEKNIENLKNGKSVTLGGRVRDVRHTEQKEEVDL